MDGTGSDGAPSISGTVTINTIVSVVTTGTSGQSSLSVSSTTGFAPGQVVFIHQSQGTNAGVWEKHSLVLVGTGALTLDAPLTNSYSSTGGNNHAQVIEAPQYTDVTVPSGATLTAPAWNGTTGGILVFNSTGTVSVSGTISMNGLGFAGGVGSNFDPLGLLEYKTQGDSYPGPGTTQLTTNTANGGGGNGGAKQEGCEGGGGGGGGYGTAGATGGTHVGCGAGVPGGVGGSAYGTANLSTMFFGSGGGSGGYTTVAAQGHGGNGGGMVVMFGSTISLNVAAAIDVSGTSGTAEFGDYGGGGGGAGGSAYLSHGSPVAGFSNIKAAGGSGGTASGAEVGGAGGNGISFEVP